MITDSQKLVNILVLYVTLDFFISSTYIEPILCCTTIIIGIISAFVLAIIYRNCVKFVTATPNCGNKIGAGNSHATTIIFILKEMNNVIRDVAERIAPMWMLSEVFCLFRNNREW